MTDPRDAMKAAVTVLEECREFFDTCSDYDGQETNNLDTRCMDALSLLRAALEAREEPKIDAKSILERAANAPNKAKCAMCNGRGFHGIPGQRCTFCDGKGMVQWRSSTLAASPVAAPVEARPVAIRYKDRHGRWRYLNLPFTKGWTFPPNLGTPEPLYASPVAADTQGDARKLTADDVQAKEPKL